MALYKPHWIESFVQGKQEFCTEVLGLVEPTDTFLGDEKEGTGTKFE